MTLVLWAGCFMSPRAAAVNAGRLDMSFLVRGILRKSKTMRVRAQIEQYLTGMDRGRDKYIVITNVEEWLKFDLLKLSH